MLKTEKGLYTHGYHYSVIADGGGPAAVRERQGWEDPKGPYKEFNFIGQMIGGHLRWILCFTGVTLIVMEEEYKRKGPKEWLVRGYSTERWGQNPSLKEKWEQTEAGLFYS